MQTTKPSAMKSATFLASLTLLAFALSCNAFVVQHKATAIERQAAPPLYDFLGDRERDALTRESEPEEFFAT